VTTVLARLDLLPKHLSAGPTGAKNARTFDSIRGVCVLMHGSDEEGYFRFCSSLLM
jgi:hypothetical protein